MPKSYLDISTTTMENIFDTNQLYPDYEEPIKDHFKGYFDSVYVSFSPFFTIANSDAFNSVSSAKLVSDEEYRLLPEAVELSPNENRAIYVRDPQYPDNTAIVSSAKPVKWQQIIDHTLISNFAEMSLALRTSIGALRREYERTDLRDILIDQTSDLSVYHPIEGRINVLSLMQMYECLKDLHKTTLVVTDEFFEDRKVIDIGLMSLTQFVTEVHGYMYYFTEDRTVLFTIEWDSFFFLICADHDLLAHIVARYRFEGFYCDANTTHDWYLDAKQKR
ncbi:DUF2711 domain-containing protein [Mucilaginibacter daejeonensis]|uniref:DUF2711 family protein n=1 Tax=Mucilaginibacter daejeonensis TaxID=398049 RepID=UPI001D1783EB|nr:DUF2711 family protein [Mucilaginibacter daejeonensis]UEG54563.1 DUF2711 domain-containing protein [Mucilaginibacter daejeonensis]